MNIHQKMHHSIPRVVVANSFPWQLAGPSESRTLWLLLFMKIVIIISTLDTQQTCIISDAKWFSIWDPYWAVTRGTAKFGIFNLWKSAFSQRIVPFYLSEWQCVVMLYCFHWVRDWATWHPLELSLYTLWQYLSRGRGSHNRGQHKGELHHNGEVQGDQEKTRTMC